MEDYRHFHLQTHKDVKNYNQAFEIGKDKLGSKAFNIAFCKKNQFPVPDGIIVSRQAFFSYIRGENLALLFKSIKSNFDNNCMLIVRSSALKEDSAKASYAGQFMSIACQNNIEEIKKSCGTCWSSYYSLNVAAYSKNVEKSYSEGDKNGMALVVQKLLNASSAGVCFTKDPQSEENNKIVINAVYGLGETLVNSDVVSDHYEFDINTKAIVLKTIGKQKFYIAPEDPSNSKPVPDELAKKQVLSSDQIIQVALMAQNAASLFNNHLDIEWAFEDDNLFLLQARPITRTINKKKYELWTRDNVADVIPDAVTPMTWSIVKHATNNGFKIAIQNLGFPSSNSDLFKLFDGKIYFNQTLYQGLLSPIEKQNFWFVLRAACKYFKAFLTFHRTCTRYNNQFQKQLNKIFSQHGNHPITELKQFFEKYMAIHINNTILMELGFSITRKIISRFMSDEKINDIVDGLVTGIDNIESTSYGDALWEIAGLIKKESKLSEAILISEVQSVPDLIKENGGLILSKWEAFIADYGYTSLKEFEVYYPRWSENPNFVISILKQYIENYEKIDTNKNQNYRLEIKKKTEKLILNQVPFYYYPILKLYIKHIQQASFWRELFKQKIVKIVAEIRKHALFFAKEFKCDPLDNIFFLTIEEMVQLKNKSIPTELDRQMFSRKTSWESLKNKEPFEEIRIFADGEKIKISYISETSNTLKGLPLSSGKYKGVAKIIIDPVQIVSFNKGDILVARSTNPSWTPLFTLSGAIITDMGNYLSHGAIVAREMGIPAVGNVFDATKRIRNGQTLFVDGENGIIYLDQ